VRAGAWLVITVTAAAMGPACYALPQKQHDEAVPQESTSVKSVHTSAVVIPSVPNSWGSTDHENSLGLRFIEHLARDQRAIWTSPAHLRMVDADWLIPFGMVTGTMLATDSKYSKHLSNSPSRLKTSNNLSNYGMGALAGVGAGFYFWGRMTHDEQRSETGLLAGEAAIDSFAVTYGLKYAFGRQRPLQNNYHGNFFSGGDSLPSEHAAAAWSIASVIAHEYPGTLTTFLAYGAASAISLSRITAKQHFPTDVLIGSAIGWFVGQYVYRAHHDPEIGGGEWETYAESHNEGPGRKSTSTGSPYVPLDSWIYPAIERLAALGYIRSAFLGIRPWTRTECARLVEEAGDGIAGQNSDPPEAHRLYATLAKEFELYIDSLAGGPNRSARLESIYTRSMVIDGQPLNDSYHFGQTIVDDYGRPYQEGFNNVTGFSGWGTAGRFTLYVSGEYQHAPSAPAYSDQIRNLIATVDVNPVQPATPFATVNQFRLLDTYVSANLENWTLSFGKQSLWWGPDYGGELIFSNNAEPIYMFRASRTIPITLPWIFHWLGPMKTDAFFGKLSGNQFPPRPLIHGEKISFKPTPNLEFGFSRLAEMGGVGRAITPAAIFNSYTSTRESIFYKSNANPGKRTAGFDFSYRIPYLRNWLTFYTDSLSSDDVSPISNPPRAAFNPGIYLAHFPKLAKLDLRIEFVNTNNPVTTPGNGGGHFVYFDGFYHDLSTNERNLIGSWIGRQGQGVQAWSTYWFSAKNSIQLGYRHAKVANDFIPFGETVNDGSLKVNWWFGHDVNLSTFVQYEQWRAPVLAPSPQTNWTTAVQVAFWPRSWSK
jgi:capsule assembly protein Wzi/PAP2 superfamily protein